MIIEQQKTLIYKILITEEELDSLIGCLSIAKSDWNISDTGVEILEKLKSMKSIDGISTNNAKTPLLEKGDTGSNPVARDKTLVSSSGKYSESTNTAPSKEKSVTEEEKEGVTTK